MKIRCADLERLLETIMVKAELENKIGIRKNLEEASGTNIKKWSRSLTDSKSGK